MAADQIAINTSMVARTSKTGLPFNLEKTCLIDITCFMAQVKHLFAS